MADYSSYFNTRLAQEIDAQKDSGTYSKYDEVQAASRKKVADFEAADALRKLKEAQARETNKNSVVTQLGIDPESATGRAVNIAASVVSGASKNVIGTLASLPVDALSIIQGMGLDEGDIQAYNRYVQGTADEADILRLKRQNPDDIYSQSTVLDKINSSKDLREYGRRITENMDIGSLVHQGARDELRQGLQNDTTQAGLDNVSKGWEQLGNGEDGAGLVNLASGVGSLAMEAGKAAIDNPQAAVEYIAENAPQLAVGALAKVGGAALAATNMGYGADLYQQGVENYAKKHGGELPPEDVRQAMGLNAAGAVIAEHAGDKIGLGLAKAAGETAKEAAKTTFKQALLNTAKAAVGGTASEAATEGVQTYLEGEATLKPTSAQDIYEGATIGGIAGGGMSGGARGVAEAVKATPEWSDFRLAEAEKTVSHADAIKNNDISAYADDPLKAVQVLNGHARLETTTPEVRAVNEAKANEIVSGLEAKRQEIYDMTPEGIAEAQATIDTWTPEQKSANQEYVDLLAEEAKAAADMKPSEAKKLQAQMERLDRQLEQVRKVRDDLVQQTTKDINLDDQLAVLNGSDTTAHVAAANKVLTLAMAAPNRVSPEIATELAGNQANGLSEAQRTFLHSFSKARIAENRLKGMTKVEQEMVFGDSTKNQMGIVQYRNQITAAVQSGNTKEASRLMTGLSSWARIQGQKADLISSLYAEVKGTGEQRFMKYSKDTGWVEVPAPKDVQKFKATAEGLVIDVASPKLEQRAQAGKEALNFALEEMKAAQSLKAGPAVVDTQVKSTEKTAVDSSESQSQVTSGNPVSQTAVEGQTQYKVDSTVDVSGTSTSDTNQAASETPADEVELQRLQDERAAMSTEEQDVAAQLDSLSQDQRDELGSTLTEESPVDVQSTPATEEQTPTISESATNGDPEERGSDSETQEEDVRGDQGKLEVLSREAAPKGTFLTEVSAQGKLFATYLTQKVQREGDTSLRPLVAVSDFMSKLLNREVLASQFLPKDSFKGKGSPEQRSIIGLFVNLAPQWSAKIREYLVQTEDKAAAFRYKDPILELLVKGEDGKWDLPENVKTAMVYAGMSYVVEQANRPAINSDEDINRMLGRPEEFEVLPFERDLLGDALARKYTVANALGKRAIQALGLAAKPTAPQEFLPNLEASVGNHILNLLVQRGVLTSVVVSNDDLVKAGGKEDESSMTAEEFAEKQKRDEKAGFSTHIFIKITRDEEFNLSEEADRIAGAARGSKGVLDNLFSVDSGSIAPTLAPVDFTQQRTKRGQSIPQKLAETLQRDNAQPNRLKQDVYHTFFGLSEEAQVKIASGEWITDGTQAMLADGIKARNEALEREIKNFREFVDYFLAQSEQGDDIFNTPFYFQHDVWNQFRVGILNNLVNPQMSKIVRHLIQRDSWESEVAFDNDAQMDNFKLRVLESFGVKTSHENSTISLKRMQDLFLPVAKRTGTDTSDKFKAINQAVDALVSQLKSGELTDIQEAQIIQGVKEAGEKMLSYDGMVALAQFRMAQEAYESALAKGVDKAQLPPASFKTAMMSEIDGVSNGPILAHLLFGAADSPEALAEFLKKGGFYSIDDALEHYNDWRGQPGKADLYESMTIAAFEVLERHKAALPSKFENPFVARVIREKYDAVQSFIGELMKDGSVTSAGRNLSKEPIRPLVFGSSKHRAIEAMAQSYIDSIAKTLQKLPDTPQARKEALTNLNKLLWTKEKDQMIPVNLDRKQILALNFLPEQRATIANAFKTTFGKAYGEAIDTELGAFLERRNQITRATELSFVLYNSAREALREAFIQDLIAKGELDSYAVKKDGKETGARKPRHGLNALQEKAFQKTIEHLAPMVHTSMSLDQGSLDAGLPGFVRETKIADNSLHSVEVHFPDSSKKGYRVENISSPEQVLEGPGVRLTSMPIHAADSATSHGANPEGHRINLHDAGGTGLNDFTAMGQDMNKALWNTVLNYSPIREVANSLQRTIQGTAALLQRSGKDMTTEQRNALLDSLAKGLAKFAEKHEIAADSLLPLVMNEVQYTAYEADLYRLTVLEKTGVLDQYASEGARFKPENADRQAATDQLAGLKEKDALDEKTETGIDIIKNMTEPKVKKYHDELMAQAAVRTHTRTLSRMTVGEVTQALRALILDNTQERTLREDANTLRKAFAKPDATLRTAQTASKLSSERLDALMVALGERLKGHVLPTNGVTGNPVPTVVQPMEEVELTIPKITNTVFGELGTPDNPLDPALITLEKAGNISSVGEVITALSQSKQLTSANKKILMLLKRVLPPELPVEIIKATTNPDGIMRPEGPSYGWTGLDLDSNKIERVFIMGSEYKLSGLFPEVVLHELVHAALVRVTDDAYIDFLTADSVSAPISSFSEAYLELEELQKAAMAYAKEKGITEWDMAMSSIHEFIAYGMTSQKFQQDVLTKIRFKSKTKNNKLVTGMQAFISSLVSLLFKKPNENLENGLTVLIQNVSALAYKAGLDQQQEKTSTGNKNSRVLSMAATPKDYTTTDLFDALDDQKVTPQFADHLRGLLSGMVERIFPESAVIGDRVVYQNSPDVKTAWESLRRMPTVTFATEAAMAGFPASAQETFAAEQVMTTVRAVLDRNEHQATQSYKELAKLYREMRDTLKTDGSDFNTGNAQQDQALYDFIFKMEAGADGRTDHLARFATLGLTNQTFNKALERSTAGTQTSSSKGFTARLTNWLYQAMEWLVGKATHTYAGQQANEKLLQLVDNLVHIEDQTRARLESDKASILDPIEEKLTKAAEGAKKAVGDLAKTHLVQGSSKTMVKFAGNVISIVAGNRVDQYMNALEAYRDKHFKEHLGVVAGITNEIRGARPGNMVFHALLRASKHLEGLRKNLMTQTSKVVLESFADKGKNLSLEEKSAVTAVFLRTDLSALLDSLGMAGIQRVLNSKSALASEIGLAETALNAFPQLQNFFINEAQILGLYMAKGETKGTHLLMNAHNIAREAGSDQAIGLTEAEATAAEAIIDRLVSLYALQYSDQRHLTHARNVLNGEMNRGPENGVEMVLKLHRQLQQQSKDRLFQNSAGLMMKGYTPEIYNPHREIVIAAARQGAELEAMGYIKGAEVKPDPKDPDQDKRHMYLLEHGGLRSHLTGIFSYTGQRAKGSRAASDEVRSLDDWKEDQNNLKTMRLNKRADIRALYTTRIDPTKVKDTYAAPVMNDQGKVSGYRYLMKNETKDVQLERNNQFDKIMGNLAGGIFDKETATEQNTKAVQALYDQYQAEFATRSDSYVVIDESSTDPEYRDIYRLLPEETKKAIKAIWGDEPMMVRVDLLDINFGYRKSSLSTWFEKDYQVKGVADKFFVDYIRPHLPAKAALRIRQTEDVFQELVRETKDILVVKTGLTLLGNVTSNFTLLGWYGVPAGDMLRHHKVALRGAMDYKRDSDNLARLTMQLASGYVTGNRAEMEREVVRLKNEIERNPVKKLIDAGMMPTIVEDVAADEDIYSYKTNLVQKTEAFTDKLNPTVVAVGKQIYMAKDTKIYQAMYYGTQISDFLAKYTLYQYATTRKKNPLSHEEAVQLASDAFVNYDIPSHRTVQYLNDMGIVWFTKYYLRIQKVIAHLYAEKPGRALMLLSLSHFFSGVPTLMDSSFIHKLHNPFSIGAFKLPSVLDELATVKMGMSPFN